MIKKQKFYMKSSDKKTQICGLCWIPEDIPVIGVLQIAHGMVEYAGRYGEFAEYLAERGIAVVANDHLGHGDSVNSSEDWGYMGENGFEWMVKDLHKICRHFKKRFPQASYCLLGHSMGSFLTRYFLIQYGGELDGAVIMGTGHYPPVLTATGRGLTQLLAWIKGWHFRSQLVNRMAFGSYNRGFQPKRTDFDWLSRDEAQVDAYIREPRCQFVFTVNGYNELFKGIGVVSRMKNIKKMPEKLPILMISGDADPVGANGRGVQKVYDMFLQAGMEKVDLKLYEGGRHEILNEINRENVYEDVYHWLIQEIFRKH